MNKIIDWLRMSNRYKHLIGGMVLGIISNGWYCAVLVGLATGLALEFKDKRWGGKPDGVDFILTMGGTLLGYLFHAVLAYIFA